MKQHTVIGADALDEAQNFLVSGSFLDMAAEIARYHHEWFEGSGYPDGIRGQDIPLAARIVAVADVFDTRYNDILALYRMFHSPSFTQSVQVV